jgi:hypothetical protein
MQLIIWLSAVVEVVHLAVAVAVELLLPGGRFSQITQAQNGRPPVIHLLLQLEKLSTLQLAVEENLVGVVPIDAPLTHQLRTLAQNQHDLPQMALTQFSEVSVRLEADSVEDRGRLQEIVVDQAVVPDTTLRQTQVQHLRRQL